MATSWAVGLIEQHELTPWLGVPLEWLAENASYYLAAWPCEKLLPAHSHVLGTDKESLKRLQIVEFLDASIRISLLTGVHFAPFELRLSLAFWLSFAADVLFVLSLNRSHRLCEIYDGLLIRYRHRSKPRLTTIGLALTA